jgi:hypothetical protein
MRFFRALTRGLTLTVTSAAAGALASGCAGPATQLSPASAPLASASQTQRDTGWLSPAAKSGALLYVADQSNQRVVLFSQKGKSRAPVGQITDAIGGPDGLFVDRAGTLYVCNFGLGNITEYPQGQTTHSKTLTGPISPKYVTAGVDGTVYVSDFEDGTNGQVLEYAGGSTTPTSSIQLASYPAGLALDKHNNLYVAYTDQTNNDIEVQEFAPGSTTGTNLGISLKFANAGGLVIDKSGNLLVDNQSLPGVEIFPPGATEPSQQITGFSLAYQIALDKRDNRLYVSDPFGPAVVEVTYPAGAKIATFAQTLAGAFGVAVSPDSEY